MTYLNLMKLNLSIFSTQQIQHVLAKNKLQAKLVIVFFCGTQSANNM